MKVLQISISRAVGGAALLLYAYLLMDFAMLVSKSD